jgi:hypothetical protein
MMKDDIGMILSVLMMFLVSVLLFGSFSLLASIFEEARPRY